MGFGLSEGEYWEKRPIDSHSDWGDESKFLESYRNSVDHSHRELILDVLKDFNAKSLLEVGCCNGPNLMKIKKTFPFIELAGEDVNKHAIKDAKKWLPTVSLTVCKLPQIKAEDKSYDCVLADACLMYVEDIETALNEMTRVARKGVIIFDWFTPAETKINYSYTRNWLHRLTLAGFKNIHIRKLTEKEWPNDQWLQHGRFISAAL